MKKFFLGALALTMCVALTACGSAKPDATISSLSTQLDNTANIVSKVQTISPTDISTNDMSQFSTMSAESARGSLANEEYYKMDILNKTAKIKNGLSGLKLSKAQASAIRDLTDNLTKYTNSVSNSKSELSSTVKSISSMKKNYNKNQDKINAKLNRLANNSNARVSYYQNILNTLDQIEQYIQPSQDEKSLGYNIADVEDVVDDTNQEQEKEDKQVTHKRHNMKRNIDTYLPQTTCPECGKEINGKVCPNCGKTVVIPERVHQTDNRLNNGVAPINYGYGNGAMPMYNGYYGYNGNFMNPANPYGFNSNNINYGAYPNRFGGNYGFYGNNMLNPNRNTDTYAPYMRNIDTYKGFGGYNGINQQTTFVSKEETDEKIEEKDNIEKFEEKEVNEVEETKEEKENKDVSAEVSALENTPRKIAKGEPQIINRNSDKAVAYDSQTKQENGKNHENEQKFAEKTIKNEENLKIA